MSINGISQQPLLPNYGAARPGTAATQQAAQQATQQAAQQARAQQTALKPQAPIAGQGAAQGSLPAEAPQGTDPTLWSVLTTEERNFFAKTAALGPLTYSRIKAVTHPAPPVAARGVRLDVRA